MKKYFAIIIAVIMISSTIQLIGNFAEERRPDKWNYQAEWCENMTWIESFKLKHNTTRTIFHQYCRI